MLVMIVAIKSETELYAPIKLMLEEQGYEVKGEVNGCDIVAVKDDETVIVELKPSFNLELVFQGIDRQRISDNVYLAVEAPARKGKPLERWNEAKKLCRRLELGLIGVSFSSAGTKVEVVCDPSTPVRKKDNRRRSRLMGEFTRRSGDHNEGGSNRRPLVTAYRQQALRLASVMTGGEPMRIKTVRDMAGVVKAYTILRRNVYGWFRWVDKGMYALSPEGFRAVERYADVLAGLTITPIVRPISPRRIASLQILRYLDSEGPSPIKVIKEATGLIDAAELLQANPYRWFERISRGVYSLSELGRDEVGRNKDDADGSTSA